MERGFSRCWVVLWGLPSAALGARPGAIPCVSPALPGSGSRAPRGALAAAEVSCAGKRPPGAAVGRAMGLGEPGGCPSRGAWAFLPPLCSPGQRVTMASLPFAACDTLWQRQRQRQGRGAAPQLILSSPQPAAERKHGRGDRVELPRLLRCSEGRCLRAAMPTPVLPGLHPALGKKDTKLPTLQNTDAEGQVFCAGSR